MRESYDIKNLNPRKNPYSKELKQQITIKLSQVVIEYFKSESEETGIPYQTLINLYLSDCVKEKRKIDIKWNKAS
jgi:predicted DNA binding CopG/RHH family protein